nr:MAG TPA: hypothetical protein [Caudoviricetes sp.]
MNHDSLFFKLNNIIFFKYLNNLIISHIFVT